MNFKLIYQGDFSEGKWYGKGKENEEDNNLIFDGEFLDSKRNWKGKEYYKER